MHFKKCFLLLFLSNIIFLNYAVAQQRDLNFYRNAAYTNSPVLKENINQQQYIGLQNELVTTIYRKPQVYFTADYLFAPYFFNNGRFISITPYPDKSAFGYDATLSNGGLYAAQLNVSTLLFAGKLIKPYANQTAVQKNVLQNVNKQVMHEIEKSISDQYITAYQLQQQVFYLDKIIALVEDRKKIVEVLVQKALMQQNDYLLLEIEIRQRQYDIQQQRINLYNAFNQLNNIAGIADTSIVVLEAPQIVQSPQLEQFNYQQRYLLDSANIISQQLIFNTKYRPTLAAYGNTGLNAINTSTLPHSFGLSAGLHLNIPIYDGGQKRIVEKQSQLELENLKQYHGLTTIQLQNNLATLSKEINLTTQTIALLNAQLSTQETLLQIIKDKVVIGQVSVTDYKNALQDYALSNQNKIQAQTNLWLLINQYNYINW
jgi:outer membrane protein TolC